MTNNEERFPFKESKNIFLRELYKLVEIGFTDFLEKLEKKKYYYKNQERLIENFYKIVSRQIFIHVVEDNFYFNLVVIDGKNELEIKKPEVISLINDLLESGLFVARFSEFEYTTQVALKLPNPFEQALFNYAVLMRQKKHENKDYSDIDTELLREANQESKILDADEFDREFTRIYKNFHNFLVRENAKERVFKKSLKE